MIKNCLSIFIHGNIWKKIAENELPSENASQILFMNNTSMLVNINLYNLSEILSSGKTLENIVNCL